MLFSIADPHPSKRAGLARVSNLTLRRQLDAYGRAVERFFDAARRDAKPKPAALARIIHATRKSNDRVSIEVEPCRSEGTSAKGFIVMLGARQTV
jgi:hypothetical protein